MYLLIPYNSFHSRCGSFALIIVLICCQSISIHWLVLGASCCLITASLPREFSQLEPFALIQCMQVRNDNFTVFLRVKPSSIPPTWSRTQYHGELGVFGNLVSWTRGFANYNIYVFGSSAKIALPIFYIKLKGLPGDFCRNENIRTLDMDLSKVVDVERILRLLHEIFPKYSSDGQRTSYHFYKYIQTWLVNDPYNGI